MKKKLILIGGGGHCKSCIDVIEQEGSFTIAGIIDLPAKVGGMVLGHAIIGADNDIPSLTADHHFLITIGHIKSAERRVNIYQTLHAAKAVSSPIISPAAYVSPHAQIGMGTIIMPGATVNAAAVIGNNCIINSHALIEHDAVISDHCHIATGAIINGGVQVGEQTFIGSRSMIREYINIGKNSFIAAGLSIYKDLASQSVVKPR